MDNIDISKIIEEDEIDLIAIIKPIIQQRKIIYKSLIICVFIGLLVAIFSPKEYKATSVFVPQINNKGAGGSLSGLASMASINLNSLGNSEELSPDIYPQIISSPSFLKDIIKLKLKPENSKDSISFFDYFTDYKGTSLIGGIKKYTISLPGLLIKTIKGTKKETTSFNNSNSSILALSADEYNLQKQIENIISIDIDNSTNCVTLTATMPEAYMAAQVAKEAKFLLQKYITQIKVNKVSNELNFVQKRYIEQEKIFYAAQNKLATYNDSHKNVTSARAQSEFDRLSADYNLKLSVYTELAKQLEQAKLEVTKKTPSFSVIQEVTVPNEKSAPKRRSILIIWIFLGISIGVGIIFAKNYFLSIKEKWDA